VSTHPHLEESLQREIDVIRERAKTMGALCEKALRDCMTALATRDRQAAYAIILRDRNIDALEKDLDRLCLEFIARQQPVAGLLRFAHATFKIALELERVGDYAESIAKQIVKLADQPADIPLDRFHQMADLSIPMLHDAMQAYVSQDAELARRTAATERTVDALKSGLTRELMMRTRTEDLPFDALNPLIVVAKRLERVSDQARNICMEVLYMCTGKNPKHPDADVFRVLFVDADNSCRSQMAEAIASAMHLQDFIFASAGVDPQPIEPATVSFMKEHGLDISRMAPKAINMVPELERFDAIVALSPEAKRAFPQHPKKIVYLDWDVEDPSQTRGSQEEIAAAYKRSFDAIRTNIDHLIGAILDPKPE